MTRKHPDPPRAANLAENPHAGQGPVLLDIEDDIGAIVLHLTAALEGAEVEIEPAEHHGEHERVQGSHDHGHERDRPHVAVVGRPVAHGLAYTAVFPELHANRYALSVTGQPGHLVIDVRGGEVSEARWPGV
jgi:hypothetical protein